MKKVILFLVLVFFVNLQSQAAHKYFDILGTINATSGKIIVPKLCCPEPNYLKMNDFFREIGSELGADHAHPTNGFYSAEYRVDYDKVLIDIYYKNGIKTGLEITIKEGVFTNVRVRYDGDGFPAFFANYVFKSVLISIIKDEMKKNESQSTFWMDLLDKIDGMSTLFFLLF
ncbi:MAG: hypothetical protein MUE81_10950 [Thermoflexibacter sp.]|nr:hypothetical protein [Thermoflexibacter sp.]